MSVKNLKNEAQSILKSLSVREKYQMFEIVLAQMGKHQSTQKQAELQAVYRELVHDPVLEKSRLRSMEKGYGSSMIDDIRAGDLVSNQKKNKRKN